MNKWVVRLENEGLGEIRKEMENEFVTVYQWTPSQDKLNSCDDKENTAQICDTGGHMEYTVFNGVSLTDKSLIIILFNAKNYFGHPESYQQMIGCYLDLITSKTSDAAILLVAGHADELNKSDFLGKNKHEELEKVFEQAQDQINKRLEQRSQQSRHLKPNIKLISHWKTKIFLLQ